MKPEHVINQFMTFTINSLRLQRRQLRPFHLLLVRCLFFSIVPATHGFISFHHEQVGRLDELLITKVHAPHWTIHYNFENCGPVDEETEKSIHRSQRSSSNPGYNRCGNTPIVRSSTIFATSARQTMQPPAPLPTCGYSFTVSFGFLMHTSAEIHPASIYAVARKWWGTLWTPSSMKQGMPSV